MHEGTGRSNGPPWRRSADMPATAPAPVRTSQRCRVPVRTCPVVRAADAADSFLHSSLRRTKLHTSGAMQLPNFMAKPTRTVRGQASGPPRERRACAAGQQPARRRCGISGGLGPLPDHCQASDQADGSVAGAPDAEVLGKVVTPGSGRDHATASTVARRSQRATTVTATGVFCRGSDRRRAVTVKLRRYRPVIAGTAWRSSGGDPSRNHHFQQQHEGRAAEGKDRL